MTVRWWWSLNNHEIKAWGLVARRASRCDDDGARRTRNLLLRRLNAQSYAVAMRTPLSTAIVLLALGIPALAARPPAYRVFSNWTAVHGTVGSERVCYAFSRAIGGTNSASAPVIIVSERRSFHDEVLVRTAEPYPTQADVLMQVDQQPPMFFYVQGNSAFAHDGHVTVALMKVGGRVRTSWTHKHHRHVDYFSLSGFSAAYHAIITACANR